MNALEELDKLVARCEPAFRIKGGLGRVKMPEGYALMFTEPGEGHYFGLKWDGTETGITVNKWSVYRWAKADAAKANKEKP